MQGVEGQIFNPMARPMATRCVALLATFTVTPVLVSFLIPNMCRRPKPLSCGQSEPCTRHITAGAQRAQNHDPAGFVSRLERVPGVKPWNGVSARSRRGQSLDSRIDAADDFPRSRNANREPDARDPESHPEVITVVSQHGARQRQRCDRLFQRRVFCALKPFGQWEAGRTKDDLVKDLQDEFAKEFTGIDMNFSQYIQDNIEEGLRG